VNRCQTDLRIDPARASSGEHEVTCQGRGREKIKTASQAARKSRLYLRSRSCPVTLALRLGAKPSASHLARWISDVGTQGAGRTYGNRSSRRMVRVGVVGWVGVQLGAQCRPFLGRIRTPHGDGPWISDVACPLAKTEPASNRDCRGSDRRRRRHKEAGAESLCNHTAICLWIGSPSRQCDSRIASKSRDVNAGPMSFAAGSLVAATSWMSRPWQPARSSVEVSPV